MQRIRRAQRRRTIQPMIGLAIGLVSATANAQLSETLNETAAERLFREARQLMSQGDYNKACPKLAESQRLDPGDGTLLNLAYCYAQNGQTASAWATYLKAAQSARRSGQTQREAFAQKAAAALESQLARIVLELPEQARLRGLQIRMDEIVVPAALWDEPIPVDPGARVISVTAPGHQEWTTKLDISVPQKEPILVQIPPLNATPPPPTPPKQRPPEPARTAAAPSGAPWASIAFGVGAAGITTGIIVGLASLELDRSESLRGVSIGSLVVGGIGLGAGMVLLLTEPTSERTEHGRFPRRLTVSVGLGGVSVAGSL